MQRPHCACFSQRHDSSRRATVFEGVTLSSLVSLQMNLQVQADFHTKHFFIACQEEFTQSCKKRINFILMASPHLSLCLPASFPSLLFSPPVPLSSLSAEWLCEMDVMRQVHAWREMEGGPWRSAPAVNKVKNNQLTVGRGSPRARRGSQRRSHATIHHFLPRNDFFTFSQLSLGQAQFRFFCPFVCKPVSIWQRVAFECLSFILWPLWAQDARFFKLLY